LQYVEQDPSSEAWELYLTGLERYADPSAPEGPRPRAWPPARKAEVRDKALEVLDLLASATADWAREGLCQSVGPDAGTNLHPVRWALLHPVMYHVEGLPTIQQLLDKLARLQEMTPRSRAVLAAIDDAKTDLQLLRCPPWRAYPCIELTPTVQLWPPSITCAVQPGTSGKKKKGQPQYYYRVTLEGRAGKRKDAITELGHRLVCWAAHGPPPITRDFHASTACVMHLCGNPRCLSAGHLRHGTKEHNQVCNARSAHRVSRWQDIGWKEAWKDWQEDT